MEDSDANLRLSMRSCSERVAQMFSAEAAMMDVGAARAAIQAAMRELRRVDAELATSAPPPPLAIDGSNTYSTAMTMSSSSIQSASQSGKSDGPFAPRTRAYTTCPGDLDPMLEVPDIAITGNSTSQTTAAVGDIIRPKFLGPSEGLNFFFPTPTALDLSRAAPAPSMSDVSRQRAAATADGPRAAPSSAQRRRDDSSLVSNSSNRLKGNPAQLGFENIVDLAVSNWLNENFSSREERKGAQEGFQLQLAVPMAFSPGLPPPRGSASQFYSSGSTDQPELSLFTPVGSPTTSHYRGNLLHQHSTISVAVSDTSALTNNGVPLSLPGFTVPAAKSAAFSRSTKRFHDSVNSDQSVVESLVHSFGIPLLLDVDSPDFDIFALGSELGSSDDILAVVAMNILLKYNFVGSLGLDLEKLLCFLRQIQALYPNNPYHNRVHAADVLQTTHVFLCVNGMRENFSDVELLAVLLAAVVHDVGHLGIGNAFLNRIRHPLAQIYSDISPLESMHSFIAFHVLSQPSCAFFAESHIVSRAVYEDFKSLVVEALLGTDMKHHLKHMKEVVGILEDGLIADHEVGPLLKSILHAADLSNPMKPTHIYKKWAERVMAEFWQQGDEERRRGLPISPLCGRDGANIGKSQIGFINFVVRPFVTELSPVLPSVWLQRLDSNVAAMGALVPQDEEVHVLAIQRMSGTPWVDNLPPLARIFDLTLGTTSVRSAVRGGSGSRPSDDRSLPLIPAPPVPHSSAVRNSGGSLPALEGGLTPKRLGHVYARRARNLGDDVPTPSWLLHLTSKEYK